MGHLQANYTLEVDHNKQIFRLSIPVFRGSAPLPQSIAHFFASLPVQPTSLTLEQGKVVLREEIPFNWGFQPTLRQQVYRFLRRAQQCRQLFSHVESIEKIHDAHSILDS